MCKSLELHFCYMFPKSDIYALCFANIWKQEVLFIQFHFPDEICGRLQGLQSNKSNADVFIFFNYGAIWIVSCGHYSFLVLMFSE